MKFNLVIDKKAPELEGHQNLLLSELEQVPASACTSLILNGTLNYITDEQLDMVLGKVRHGGGVSISAPDAMLVASALYAGDIDLLAFSHLTSQRARQWELTVVRSILEQRGYRVEVAANKDLTFHVRARRP